MLRQLMLVGAALICATGPSFSQEARDPCAAIGELAQTIMTARQSGMTMSVMMGTLSDDGAKDITRQMIIAAYQEPQYNVEKNRAEAATNFRNEVELACYMQQQPVQDLEAPQ